MVVRRQPTAHNKAPRPATTPEGREKQLISQAMDLVEQRILDGTASAQETIHFLKLATSREQLEQAKLRKENELLQARVESMASMKNVEELYGQALNAMRQYSGQMTEHDLDD